MAMPQIWRWTVDNIYTKRTFKRETLNFSINTARLIYSSKTYPANWRLLHATNICHHLIKQLTYIEILMILMILKRHFNKTLSTYRYQCLMSVTRDQMTYFYSQNLISRQHSKMSRQMIDVNWNTSLSWQLTLPVCRQEFVKKVLS